MNLASSTPPAVPKLNATTPIIMILMVWKDRNVVPVAVQPTLTPRKMVTMLISSFCTVLLSRSVTPHSLKRLPSIRQAMRGAAEGTSSATKMVTTMPAEIPFETIVLRVFRPRWIIFVPVSACW